MMWASISFVLYTAYISCWIAPYLFLFVGTWIASSVIRPLGILTVVLAVGLHPQSALRKFQLFINTILYLLLCNDKRWKRPKVDPATYFMETKNKKDQKQEKEKGGGGKEEETTNTTREEDKKNDASPIVIEKKTIIFVRHGESTWNDTFNKGDRKTLAFVQGFVPGLVKALVMEWYFWVTGQENESWFYDAPPLS